MDLRHGRTQLDRLPVAWHAVPGNHDIGDNPWPGAPEGIAVNAGRHQRWLDIVGADHWSVTAGGWVLLAINAQLLGSGLAAEAAQWSWLEDQAGSHRGRQPVALITHKPVTATGTELAAAQPHEKAEYEIHYNANRYGHYAISLLITIFFLLLSLFRCACTASAR